MIKYNKELEIRHDVDVLVVGGGPSGVAAAVSAARQGAKVFLAEAHTCFGGLGTAALVPAFMQFSDGINFCAAGIGEEVLTKMNENTEIVTPNNHSIKVEALKRVYDDMVVEAGVKFAFMTKLVDVVSENGNVKYAIFDGKKGMFAVKAKMFIDGTGDGDLAAMAGAEFEKGDDNGNMMAGTLCTLWANIDWNETKPQDNRMLDKAFEDNVFTNQDRHLPGMWRVGNTVGGGNIGHTFGVDGTDEESLTEALVWGRKLATEYKKYYKEYLVDGFKDMELVGTGSLLGIRETRRIMGDYVMVLDDFVNRATFDDEIGRYSYPVDIHASDTSKKSFDVFMKEHTNLRYDTGENYGIPYRILTPLKLNNVLVAGRCVSCDRFIQSSIRVMPGCYITGQAAGIAATIAVEQNTDIRGFNVKELQKRLVDIGGYLPNYSE